MNQAVQIFSVNAMNWKALTCLAGILLIPIAIVVLAARMTRVQSPFFAWFAIGIVCLVGIAILLQILSVRLKVDGSKLVVGGGLYAITVDRNNIIKDQVRELSESDNNYQLYYRSNGVGLPGFALGWFQASGGKKIFALATGRTKILVPTNAGYDIIVSPVNGGAFISSIQSM